VEEALRLYPPIAALSRMPGPHLRRLGSRRPKLQTGCAAVQHWSDPHWGARRRHSIAKSRAMARADASGRSPGQLDEQTLTVFIPVSASARVL